MCVFAKLIVDQLVSLWPVLAKYRAYDSALMYC